MTSRSSSAPLRVGLQDNGFIVAQQVASAGEPDHRRQRLLRLPVEGGKTILVGQEPGIHRRRQLRRRLLRHLPAVDRRRQERDLVLQLVRGQPGCRRRHDRRSDRLLPGRVEQRHAGVPADDVRAEHRHDPLRDVLRRGLRRAPTPRSRPTRARTLRGAEDRPGEQLVLPVVAVDPAVGRPGRAEVRLPRAALGHDRSTPRSSSRTRPARRSRPAPPASSRSASRPAGRGAGLGSRHDRHERARPAPGAPLAGHRRDRRRRRHLRAAPAARRALPALDRAGRARRRC